MNFKITFITSVTSLLTLINLPVIAAPLEPFVLVQRNCDAGDLFLDKEIEKQTVSTNCIWSKQKMENGKVVEEKDPDMQVSLHVKDNGDNQDIYVQGHCTFTPAIDSKDKIIDVSTSKAGSSGGSSAPDTLPKNQYIISLDSTDIKLVFKLNKDEKDNFDPVTKTYQANVIFDLNKERGLSRWWPWSTISFNAGNKLNCTYQLTTNLNLPE